MRSLPSITNVVQADAGNFDQGQGGDRQLSAPQTQRRNRDERPGDRPEERPNDERWRDVPAGNSR